MGRQQEPVEQRTTMAHTHHKSGSGQDAREPDEHSTQAARLDSSRCRNRAVVTEQSTLLGHDQSKRETHPVHCALKQLYSNNNNTALFLRRLRVDRPGTMP